MSMNHFLLMEKISNKIVQNFQEISQLCKTAHKNDVQEIVVPEKSSVNTNICPPKANLSKKKQKTPKKTKVVQFPQSAEPALLKRKRGRPKKVKQVVNTKPILSPKKPSNSYSLFYSQRKRQILSHAPNLSLTTLTKLISKDWQALDTKTKDYYSSLYQKASQQYRRDLSEFNKTSFDKIPKQEDDKIIRKNGSVLRSTPERTAKSIDKQTSEWMSPAV